MRLSVLGRAAVGAALLLAEYGIIGVCFDGGDLWRRGGFLAGLANAGQLFTALIILITAGCLVHFRQLLLAVAEVSASSSALSAGWAVAHLALYGLSLLAAFAIFGPRRAHEIEISLVVLGAVAGAGALAALMRALFGSSALQLTKVLARAMAAGALLGVLAWQAGVRFQDAWPSLARVTLRFAAWLLGKLSGEPIYVDYAYAELGLRDFDVQIQAGCSGVEGMGLVFVFVAGYVFRFRGELRIWRALSLLPVAVALAWLANAFRLVALVAIGAWGAPAVALGGFHSKAGWVLFCGVSLALVLLLNHVRWFRRGAAVAPAEATHNPTAGYCMPFLSLIGVGLVSGLFVAGQLDRLYGLRLLAALAALAWARRYWPELRPSWSWTALAWGALVGAAWLLLLPQDVNANHELYAELAGLGGPLRLAWLSCRILGSVLVVPVVEELAFRGFLLRRLVSREFETVSYRDMSGFALAVSALAFGALHSSWRLGSLAGVAYALAARRRGRLADAMLAHATTNGLLAGWALWAARFDLLC